MREANIKLAAKFYPKKQSGRIDTVAERRDTQRHDILRDAYNAWHSLEPARRNAERNEMYTFGDQWGDYIRDPKTGKWITESQYIKNQGNVPLKNNRIRSITRSVLGVFSSSQTEPVCTPRDRAEQGQGEVMSTTLQYVYQLNKLWELDRRNLEYFMIAGMGFFKSTAGYRNGKNDVWTDLVNYNRVFFDNHMQDPRHWDCHLIGEIHDIGLYDLIQQFSEGSPKRAKELKDIYSYIDRESSISLLESITDNRVRDLSFTVPEDNTRCRVIEVWRKESKERIRVHDRLNGDFYKVELEDEKALEQTNAKRIADQTAKGVTPENMRLLEYEWFVDNYWYFYFLSPHGDVLLEGETPWWHESHPYSFKIYPFYNGRVYPFVSDFIDQQRYINRLITMQDFIMKASAKGVLMFPEDQKPSDMTMDEITEAWAAYNGIIYYKPKPGVEMPKQIIANTSNTGAYDMLNLQLKLLEDISGVQGAMQGQKPTSGTPSSLYMQQVQNSITSLTDLFETFRELREERDMKNLKLIQQTYSDTRYINLVGREAGSIVYDPKTVNNIEFDIAITESQSTPAYRMVMNDFLMNIFQAGQITLEEMLETGSFPFSDKLLQAINNRKQQMTDGQPQGTMIPPEIQKQLQ